MRNKNIKNKLIKIYKIVLDVFCILEIKTKHSGGEPPTPPPLTPPPPPPPTHTTTTTTTSQQHNESSIEISPRTHLNVTPCTGNILSLKKKSKNNLYTPIPSHHQPGVSSKV